MQKNIYIGKEDYENLNFSELDVFVTMNLTSTKSVKIVCC